MGQDEDRRNGAWRKGAAFAGRAAGRALRGATLRAAALIAANLPAAALPAAALAAGPAAAGDGPTGLWLGSTLSTGDQVLQGGVQLPLADDAGGLLFLGLAGAGSLAGQGWSAQAGLGWRHHLADELQAGGYGFAAYDRSANDSGFYSLAPGLELLTPSWHLSWNLYLPVGERTSATGPAAWAGETGDLQYTSFRGHRQYDRLIAPADQVGAGTDLAASLRLDPDHDIRLSLGAYHFDQEVQDRSGGSAGLQAQIAPGMTARLSYAYDSVDRNRVGLTLSFDFGVAAPPGRPRPAAADWRQRPVQHGVATAGTAQTIPISEVVAPVSGELLYRDNIWFFDPAASAYAAAAAGAAACSYERPCAAPDLDTTLAIAELAAGTAGDPALYLKTGTYSQPAGSGIALFANQSLVGRSADYRSAAAGDARPVLETATVLVSGLGGNAANGLENLVLLNNGSTALGAVIADGAGSLTLRNVAIGDAASAGPAGQFARGLYAVRADTILLSGSTVFAYRTDPAGGVAATGLDLGQVGSATVEDSLVAATAAGDGSPGAVALYLNAGTTEAVLRNSSLTATGSGAGGGAVSAIAGDTAPGNRLTIAGSSLSATAFGTGTAGAIGLRLAGAGGGTIALADSAVTVSAEGDGNAGAVAVFDGSAAGNALAMNDSTLASFASGDGAGAASLVLGGNGIATVTGAILTASHASSGDSGLVDQVQLFGNAALTISNSTVAAADESAMGAAAGNNFVLYGNSRLVLTGSTVTSTASAAAQSGGTNITTTGTAAATVRGSSLTTVFAGGPAVTEVSGAVPLWSLDASSISVTDSSVTAIGGNALTVPDPVQALDASTVTISGSTLHAAQAHGNLAAQPLPAILTDGAAQVALTDTVVVLDLSGASNDGMVAIQSYGGTQVTMTGGLLSLNNAGTATGMAALQTVGAAAHDTAAIALQGVQIRLSGGEAATAQRYDSGTVTVSD